MKNSSFRVLVACAGFFIIMAYQNCGKPTALEYGNSNVDLGSENEFTAAAMKVLTDNCYECHQPSNPMGNVSDIRNVSYLIFAGLVVPGNPDASPLFVEVKQGTMPQGKGALSNADMQTLRSWIAALSASPAPGPGTPGDPGTPIPTPTVPKFSELKSQIFSPKCMGCHASRSPNLGTYAGVMQAVVSGNASASLLYQSVTVGKGGGRMPQGGSLSSSEIKAIQDWINAGAPNN